MASILGDYNLAAVQLNVGDFRVTGFGPDDALNLAPMADLHESDSSADGAHVPVSRINDNRWEGTITVHRNTAAYRLLIDSLQTQLDESDDGAISALAFQVFDPISGDKITEANLRYMRYPDLPFNKSQSVAEIDYLIHSGIHCLVFSVRQGLVSITL